MGNFLADQKQWPRKFNAANIFYCFVFVPFKDATEQHKKSKCVQVTMCDTRLSITAQSKSRA